MYSLKGFIKLKDLVNNTPGIVSPLGELSSHSMTYSKEKGEYSSQSYPDVGLVSFLSKDSIVGPVSVASSFSSHILNVAQSLYNKAKELGPTVSRTDLLNHLIINYATTVNNLLAGDLQVNSQLGMPEWISWTNPALTENTIKIWFSDSAFRRQFDEFSIEIIPPIDNLDDFFREDITFNASLELVTQPKIMEKIHTLKNGNPETVIRAESFIYRNIYNPNYTKVVTWYAIVYGQAGDNTDAIREAIIGFNTSSSTFTDTQWEVIIPDLYKVTEFIIVPNWLAQAIPERTLQAGIYSPFINLISKYNDFKTKFPNFDEAFIDQNLQFFSHAYKSVGMLALGGITNKDDKFKLTDYYPDYVAFGTSGVDFNRMSLATQDWSYMLQELLIIAEKDSEYADLPVNVRRVVRNNKTYIVRSLNGVQYLVYSKSNDVA